ncbi:hypothetical protein ASV53_08805 [Photobacterium sanguinicancri]|uniref:Transposase n=1 Tax=Photobacterium sanguinicancri TaxID=875932 RepID=A0ABX4G0A9_9GAMM|nr:hypothetical protein ASV53_08805 [Photobacterium sanguinicancri]
MHERVPRETAEESAVKNEYEIEDDEIGECHCKGDKIPIARIRRLAAKVQYNKKSPTNSG